MRSTLIWAGLAQCLSVFQTSALGKSQVMLPPFLGDMEVIISCKFSRSENCAHTLISAG